MLGFVWSLLERIFELWTLPAASILEKLRRRTLSFDRLYTGLVVGGIGVAALVGNDLLYDGNIAMRSYRGAPSLALLFYGVATFNAWRVHRPAFALRPRSSRPWIDGGQATDLSAFCPQPNRAGSADTRNSTALSSVHGGSRLSKFAIDCPYSLSRVSRSALAY